MNLFPEYMGKCFKTIIHSLWAVLHCFPQLLGNYRSYLALPSAVIPRSNDRVDTVLDLAEKEDNCSKASSQRGPILVNRSLWDVTVLLEGIWSRWVVNPEIFSKSHKRWGSVQQWLWLERRAESPECCAEKHSSEHSLPKELAKAFMSWKFWWWGRSSVLAVEECWCFHLEDVFCRGHRFSEFLPCCYWNITINPAQ